jgi:hypothetical protein
MDTKREAQQGPKMRGERPEHYNESTEHYNESTVEKLTGAIKEESATEAAAEDKKPQYEPTTHARRCREHDTDTFLDHHAKGKKEHHAQTDMTHELDTALDKSSSTDKKETRINTYFEEEWQDVESTLFAATPYEEDNHPKDDIEELGSQHVQLRAQREALVPRSRSQEISPGAVWEGDSLGEDEGTVTFEEATEHMPSTETQDTHLISAERVHDPVLVSASIIDCLCCPYGQITAIPAALAFMGSALSILAVLSPFANCIGENYYFLFLNSGITDEQGIFYSGTTDFIAAAFSLGLISGIGGAIAFAISTGASCRTFPERFLKLLGGAYLVLAVTSILMLVALASFPAQCNVLLLWGGAFAIVAFFLYLGAGIFTIGMIKKKDVNRASVCTCCPYGNLTALPSVFGFIGSSLIMGSSIINSPAGTTGDPKLTFSLTMGVIASAVGLMVSVLGIVPGCQKVPSRDFKILGFTYILLGLMCLLTLLAYDILFLLIFSIPAFVAFTVAGFSAFYLIKVSSQAHTSDSAV